MANRHDRIRRFRYRPLRAEPLEARCVLASFGPQQVIAAADIVAIWPTTVDTADFDGDGTVDIVSASEREGTITLHLNDGGETFTDRPVGIVGSGFYIQTIAVDFDDDGDVDVISVASRDRTITWHDNDGNMQFTARPLPEINYPHVIPGDLDGDNDLDLLVKSAGNPSTPSEGILWLRNDGEGNFTKLAIAPMPSRYEVALGDLDNDGDLDVAAWSSDREEIFWYANDGNGSFAAHQTITSVGRFFIPDLNIADLDGDGDQDIVYSDKIEEAIHWLRNQGGGDFHKSHLADTGISVDQLEIADLDGDGHLDMIDDDISWYRNDGNTSFTRTEIGRRTYPFALDDLDGDDDVDIIFASENSNDVSWYLNDSSGNFVSEESVNGARIARGADLDGDGDIDVLASEFEESRVKWYENDGNQNYQEHLLLNHAIEVTDIETGDFNGDGSLDFVHVESDFRRIGVHLNRPSHFEYLNSWHIEDPQAVFPIDYDGDGDLDFLAAAWDEDSTVTLYTNQIDDWPPFAEQTIDAGEVPAYDVFAVDLNDNGILDVISAQGNSVVWHEHDGAGNYTRHTISAAELDIRSVFAADVDGDGDVDIVSAAEGGNLLAWHENDGDQVFTRRAVPTSAAGVRDVEVADIDSDGDLDLVAALATGDAVAWYENDGEQNFRERILTTDAREARSVDLVDIDGDGDLDVLSASSLDDKVAWYEQFIPPLEFYLGANRSVPEGTPISIDFSYTTTGTAAPLATVDWGDGTVDALAVDHQEKSVAGAHVYDDNGPYTVTVRRRLFGRGIDRGFGPERSAGRLDQRPFDRHARIAPRVPLRRLRSLAKRLGIV